MVAVLFAATEYSIETIFAHVDIIVVLEDFGVDNVIVVCRTLDIPL